MDNRNTRDNKRSLTNGISKRRHRRDSPEEEEEPERLRKTNRRRNNEDGDDDVDGGDEPSGTARMVPPHHLSRINNNNNRAFKPVDEIIGVSVPRKARSASRRSHENWGSPSSSNVSVRKKMKPNGLKQNPLKPSLNATSSNPKELEISNPEELEIEIAEVLYGLRTQSQVPLEKEEDSIVHSLDVVPKRKRPGQVSNNFSMSSTSAKSDTEGLSKIDDLLPNLDKNPITKSDNVIFRSAKLDFVSLETPVKDTPMSEDSHGDMAVVKVNLTSSEMDTQREKKFEIDLMAPPPQMRSSPERESDMDFVSVAADAAMKTTMLTQKKNENASKSCRDEMLVEEPELKKARSVLEADKSDKFMMIKERNIDLQLDLRKNDRDDNSESLSHNNKSYPHVQKQHQHQLNVAKDEHPHTEKTAQANSLQLPMSLPSWPSGLSPIGYMSPLPGVVSMDGSQVPPTPIQPFFSQPRPKKCATHCYIARNIYSLQQFTKMNPFWPAGAVPGKEKASQIKQQQIFIQQALPPGAAPTNMMHGPAFIFPFNQQQAAAAAASVRPGPAPANAATSASANGSAAASPTQPSMSFNFPNMPSNETQYLTLLQNNAYPFPIPNPTFRGSHPQPIPFFNGSFYHPSQMIHPSQLPHLHPPGQQNATSAPKTRPSQSSQPHQPRNTESELVNSTQALSGTSNGDNFRGENKKQQNTKLGGVEGGHPQTFAMSFASMNTAQNHAAFQNLSEADRQNYQVLQNAAAVSHVSQQRKNFKVPGEGNKNADLSNLDEEKKGLAPKPLVTGGKSIAFTRPDQQQQIQQLVQLQKHQQQQYDAARKNKTPPMSNGSVYADHLATSSPSAASKFSQKMFQSGSNNSLSQWKSSLKNAPQQSHTHISFGSGQKAQTVPHQSSSPPTNSLSKGGAATPKTPGASSQCNKASSVSSQQPKNPSILGNPHNVVSSNSGAKMQQPQMFFSTTYMQTQPPQSTSTNPANTTSGYYLQRQYPEKQQSGTPSRTLTPVPLANTAEAKAGAGVASNGTKRPTQPSGNNSFVHSAPPGFHSKPASEQKPTGNREPLTRK